MKIEKAIAISTGRARKAQNAEIEVFFDIFGTIVT